MLYNTRIEKIIAFVLTIAIFIGTLGNSNVTFADSKSKNGFTYDTSKYNVAWYALNSVCVKIET